MKNEKEYKISVDTRILELLGPNLYTNIYYVLAELIANAYDASAKNVYIISKEDEIIVEDDGNGMSYPDDINKYLNVAKETRITDDDAYTKDELHRRKMGRKGVGKLAALSVSKEVYVKTIRDNDKSGFILSRKVPDETKQLQAIKDEDINFEYIDTHGTAVVMKNPEYKLNRTSEAIKKNLLKIFPLVDENFRIHIINGDEHIIIENFDQEMIKQLGAVILIGDDFKHLKDFYTNDFEGKPNSEKLCKEYPTISHKMLLKNKYDEEKEYTLDIEGWIGVYRSTRGKKSALDTDFPDNFISLFANNKLGEFNIIPIIGKNRLTEVYVVGQIHVDLFEETSLPDMALSNRQGYRTDDLRYEIVKKEAIDLLAEVSNMRVLYAKLKDDEQEKVKQNKLEEKENELKKEVEKYNNEISNEISNKITDINKDIPENIVKDIVEQSTKKFQKAIGLKQEIDSKKKKILISQTSVNKPLADIICQMLEYNSVPLNDILYTSNENIKTHIPEGEKVYDYLEKFFVDSISSEKIYVIYVTSEQMEKRWGCVLEAGAGWITKSEYTIFNINNDGYEPQAPLNDGREWQNSIQNIDKIYMSERDINVFVNKIITICNKLGYKCKSFEDNVKELKAKIELS